MATNAPFIDKQALEDTIAAVTAEPSLGHVTLGMSGESTGGVAIKTQTSTLMQNGEADTSRKGKFTLISDEPHALLGGDSGVSPAEYALQALAGCYTVTLTAMATKKAIKLDRIKLDMYFDIDLNGFLGINPEVRNGAQKIRADVHLTSSSASQEELQELVDMLPSHSPLHDTLANPVPIETRLVNA